MNTQSARTLKIDIRSLGYGTSPSEKSRIKEKTTDFDGIDYQYMFESAYDAVIVTDQEGEILVYNERALNFFGYDGIGSFEGLTIHALIAGVTNALLKNIIAVITDHRYMRIQAFACTIRESFVPVEMIVMGTEKNSADHICYMIRDIQARRHAEQTLLSAFHAMDNTDSGIGIVDLAGKITYANRKLIAMLGAGDEEKVVGQTLQIWFENDTIVKPMTDAIMAGNDWATEKKITQSDSSHFLRISAVPDINEDDQLLGMVISLVDISDRRRAEIAELQLKHDQSIMGSISDTCHAIGQPATVLLSSLEILKDSPNINFKDRKEVEEMCYSAVLELRECLGEMNEARKQFKQSHAKTQFLTSNVNNQSAKTKRLDPKHSPPSQP